MRSLPSTALRKPLLVLLLGLSILGLLTVLTLIQISSLAKTVEAEGSVRPLIDHLRHGPTMEPKIIPFTGGPLPGIPHMPLAYRLQAKGTKA